MATAPIRPPLVPPGLPAAPTQRAGAAKAEAQRAFFDLAMGRAAPAQAGAPPAGPTPAPAGQPASKLAVQITPAPPQKILRPGSIIDIRV